MELSIHDVMPACKNYKFHNFVFHTFQIMNVKSVIISIYFVEP